MPVSTDQFRQVLSRWASGVTVVTTRREASIHGMTASSVCSVSLEPPLILVCIETLNRTHSYVAEQGVFGVHILATGQELLSDRCAGRVGVAGNLLDDVPYREEFSGAPILMDCAAWLDCRLWATYAGGDHTIYVGLVEAAGATGRSPLIWFARDYQRLAEP